MKTFRQILAVALILTVIGGNTSYAAGAVNPADQDDSAVIEETLATAVVKVNGSDVEVLSMSGSGIDPQAISSVDLVNETGRTSGNWSKDFPSYSSHTNCVKLIASCKYADGHSGNVNIKYGSYSFNTPADGTSRILGRNLNCFAGVNTISITQVSGGELIYYIKLVAEYNI